jgi:hypothetical protein
MVAGIVLVAVAMKNWPMSARSTTVPAAPLGSVAAYLLRRWRSVASAAETARLVAAAVAAPPPATELSALWTLALSCSADHDRLRDRALRRARVRRRKLARAREEAEEERRSVTRQRGHRGAAIAGRGGQCVFCAGRGTTGRDDLAVTRGPSSCSTSSRTRPAT